MYPAVPRLDLGNPHTWKDEQLAFHEKFLSRMEELLSANSQQNSLRDELVNTQSGEDSVIRDLSHLARGLPASKPVGEVLRDVESILSARAEAKPIERGEANCPPKEETVSTAGLKSSAVPAEDFRPVNRPRDEEVIEWYRRYYGWLAYYEYLHQQQCYAWGASRSRSLRAKSPQTKLQNAAQPHAPGQVPQAASNPSNGAPEPGAESKPKERGRKYPEGAAVSSRSSNNTSHARDNTNVGERRLLYSVDDPPLKTHSIYEQQREERERLKKQPRWVF